MHKLNNRCSVQVPLLLWSYVTTWLAAYSSHTTFRFDCIGISYNMSYSCKKKCQNCSIKSWVIAKNVRLLQTWPFKFRLQNLISFSLVLVNAVPSGCTDIQYYCMFTHTSSLRSCVSDLLLQPWLLLVSSWQVMECRVWLLLVKEAAERFSHVLEPQSEPDSGVTIRTESLIICSCWLLSCSWLWLTER